MRAIRGVTSWALGFQMFLPGAAFAEPLEALVVAEASETEVETEKKSGSNGSGPKRGTGSATITASSAGSSAPGLPEGPELPPLDELLVLAREGAPGVRVSEATLQASRASRVGAERPPIGNPQLTVFAERGDNNATRDVFVDGTLELPLQIWGQRGKRIAESEAFVRANQASLEVAKAQALADLIFAYGQVVVALERELVLLDAISAARQEAQVFTARLEMRDATLRDERMATMEVARNEVLLSEARADVQAGLTIIHRLTTRLYEPGPSSSRLLPPEPKDVGENPAAPAVKEAVAYSEYFARSGERAAADGKAPFSLIFRFGRGDMADTRFGGGFSIGFPFFQRNQGEIALAEAQSERARIVATNTKDALKRSADGLLREFRALTAARHTLEEVALPAARDAVLQAEQLQRAGKSDLLPILVSRRDYAALRLRKLDILARQWRLLAEIVRLTGELP